MASTEIPVLSTESVTRVAVGQQAKISREANPTTGYSWKVAEQDGVKFVGSTFERAASKGMVGVPSIQHITLEFPVQGEYNVAIKYVRPWLPDDVLNEASYRVIAEN